MQLELLVILIMIQFISTVSIEYQLGHFLHRRSKVVYTYHIGFVIVLAFTGNLLMSYLFFMEDLNLRLRMYMLIVGINSMVAGVIYLGLKELVAIKIEIFEYILVPISFGLVLYPFIDEIQTPVLTYNYFILPVILILTFAFCLGYLRYYKAMDATIHNPLDVQFFKDFFACFPIFIGLFFVYLSFLNIITFEIAMILCFLAIICGNFIAAGVFYHSSQLEDYT